jgi:hypothetical protein
LWKQVWSFAGNRERASVNQMFLQPFFAYTTTSLVTVGLNSESSANWNADDKWTIPINVSVSKLSSFGLFPASYQFGVGVFTASPASSGASWKVRFALTVLMPRRR